MNSRSNVLAFVMLTTVFSPLALGYYVASRAIAPSAPRKYDIGLHGIVQHTGSSSLVLDRSEVTRSPGTFSIWFDGGHAQLGNVLREDRATVTREIIRTDRGDLANATAGAWSGHVHISAVTLGLTSTDITLETEYGPAPAWRFDPPSTHDASAWAIHVHGLGSSRSAMLRGVTAATRANMVSLVVSYRNDGEGPVTSGSRSTLGLDEVDDVAKAVEYAVAHGARRVILFGWSMGASIALKLLVDRRYRDVIVGVVAISPVLDWVQTLRSNCRRAGLPAFIGSIASTMLLSPTVARILRLPHPLDLHKLNWLERATELSRPVLLIHGTRDTSAPIQLSRQLAQRHPDATLLEFDSDHTLEWNAQPDYWEQSVLAWIANLP